MIRRSLVALLVLALSSCSAKTITNGDAESTRAMLKHDVSQASTSPADTNGIDKSKCSPSALSGTKPVVAALCK